MKLPFIIRESIHGKELLKGGLVVTATCTSCHTAHKELPASDPESSVNRSKVSATCASCHQGIYEKFIRSVHAIGKGKDSDKLPVCNDCHSAHTIKRTDADNFKLEVMDRCGKCHRDIAMTYFDTFHGKVSKLGYGKTAKCHDCHGSHEILPIVNPRSTLSRENIVTTCMKCHPGATRRFSGYLTHATHHDPKKYPWIFWTFWSMTGLLVGVFFMSGLHTLLWLPQSLAMRKKHPPQTYDIDEKQYVRFSLRYRIMHAIMIVSFLTLAITGMTLKFSYTKWANFISHLLGGFEVSGFIHRTAAVIMFGLFFAHIGDLIRSRKTQSLTWKDILLGPNTMLITGKDIKELIATIKWYIGKGPRPVYGRWTYWEKFDYLAVFWGITIIGSSGLILWFPEAFTRFLPGWLVNVATIIHSDEALLATGFIFTIHFFNTHFRPEKFPMDKVIFTGRTSIEELKHERPTEYEALIAKQELEKHLAPPMLPEQVKVITIFAWIALIIGISLIIGIIYSIFFIYK
jgi:cytochrome b subunit of formate dehydrogenase/5-methylcytosine-specific restriction endonuclease McrA